MKKIYIINGPNLNLIGTREPDFYGNILFDEYFEKLKSEKIFSDINLFYNQSNHEGKIIDFLHYYGFNSYGIVLNAGAFSHTSIAILDAIKCIKTPVIEVHITNTFKREKFRNHSYISSVCFGSIFGFGLLSYKLAIISLLEMNHSNN